MKPYKIAGFAVLIFALSCTKENVSVKTTLAAQSSLSATTAHYLGEHFGGGIVYYIDSSGAHGLIAAEENQSSDASWTHDSIYTPTGAKGKAIGTGSKNTQKIISALGTEGPSYAALLCVNYRGGGYDDWFLPSKEELYEMSINKKYVDNLTGGNYWSSSEKDGINTFIIHFHNTLKASADKMDSFHVRAIRTF